MKVVVAIDSLKGSLSSMEAGNCIKNGILNCMSDAEVVVKPLADGGEGTVEALVAGMNGTYEEISVMGPLTEPVMCRYGILKEEKTAIIEMSGAAGITLVPDALRNPLNTTTYGVGEVILDAANKGCRKFIIGIGGSATNDGGIGMLSALGFEFLDKDGNPVALGAKGLQDIAAIKTENASALLNECEFSIACDVTNPLCGENGASHVFGPQKGANPEMVSRLDSDLAHFADLCAKTFGKDVRDAAGTGAAGGMGFAFLTFLNASLKPGIDIILNAIRLEEEIKDSDIVVTGEGRLDFQTAMGKAPIGVAKLAKKHGNKVIAFAGSTTEDAKECNAAGIDAYFSIVNGCMTLKEAMKSEVAAANMENTAEQAFRLVKVML